ncbi:MAG: hypothetical protein AAFP90_23750, partial [Planctomycetota bacterium]
FIGNPPMNVFPLAATNLSNAAQQELENAAVTSQSADGATRDPEIGFRPESATWVSDAVSQCHVTDGHLCLPVDVELRQLVGAEWLCSCKLDGWDCLLLVTQRVGGGSAESMAAGNSGTLRIPLGEVHWYG